MSRDFRRTDRETPWLLPPSLQDWLPEGHLARFVVDIVEQLDLSDLTSDYSRGGKRAYHPAMLLSLLFYGYATGVFSSRKLERATYESVAFRFIAANLHPDHARHDCRLSQAVYWAPGWPVHPDPDDGADSGGAATRECESGRYQDQGQRQQAQAMSWDYANKLEQQLQEEVAALLARAEQADEAEPDAGLDIPEELKRRRDRLEAIAAAKEEITQRAAERHRAEMAAYEEKMAARAAKEAASRPEAGRSPAARTATGPPSEGPGELHRSGIADHAVIGRLRAGVCTTHPSIAQIANSWFPPAFQTVSSRAKVRASLPRQQQHREEFHDCFMEPSPDGGRDGARESRFVSFPVPSQPFASGEKRRRWGGQIRLDMGVGSSLQCGPSGGNAA